MWAEGEDRSTAGRVVWAVRHGVSTANEAFARAAAVGGQDAGVRGRDADVDLSPRGVGQAAALARWARGSEDAHLPQLIVCSPYLRARRTLEVFLSRLGQNHRLHAVPVRWDERLRDREMGVLELLTPTAIARDHPGEAARRERVGDYAYRPPGGESLADVGQRVGRVFQDVVRGEHRRVLLVGHDATVLMLHAVVAGLTEAQLLSWSRAHPVPNASVSCWQERDGVWAATGYGDTTHLEEQDDHVR